MLSNLTLRSEATEPAHLEFGEITQSMFTPFRWLEQKIVTGEVVRDYGPIYESTRGTIGKVAEKHTLLLCRKGGRDMIVIRHSYRASLAARVSYTQIPAENAGRIAQLFLEIAGRGGTSTENRATL
jgi:hypothetical protein